MIHGETANPCYHSLISNRSLLIPFQTGLEGQHSMIALEQPAVPFGRLGLPKSLITVPAPWHRYQLPLRCVQLLGALEHIALRILSALNRDLPWAKLPILEVVVSPLVGISKWTIFKLLNYCPQRIWSSSRTKKQFFCTWPPTFVFGAGVRGCSSYDFTGRNGFKKHSVKSG